MNKERVEYIAKFFLKATKPMRLKDAVGGSAYFKVEPKKEPKLKPRARRPKVRPSRR